MRAGGRWCPWCQCWAIACADVAGHDIVWYVATPPPRQRSVVGTTLVAVFTVLVILPVLVAMLLAGLIGLGGLLG